MLSEMTCAPRPLRGRPRRRTRACRSRSTALRRCKLAVKRRMRVLESKSASLY
jgi:hypothetical protein